MGYDIFMERNVNELIKVGKYYTLTLIGGLYMKIGDVVFLNSNPEVLMTVSFVMGEKDDTNNASSMMIQPAMRIAGYVAGDVQCTWFNGPEHKTGYFKAAMLTKKD